MINQLKTKISDNEMDCSARALTTQIKKIMKENVDKTEKVKQRRNQK